jgi:hypothetical protein
MPKYCILVIVLIVGTFIGAKFPTVPASIMSKVGV